MTIPDFKISNQLYAKQCVSSGLLRRRIDTSIRPTRCECLKRQPAFRLPGPGEKLEKSGQRQTDKCGGRNDLPLSIDLNTTRILRVLFRMTFATVADRMGTAFSLRHRAGSLRNRAIPMTVRMHHRNRDESKHAKAFGKTSHCHNEPLFEMNVKSAPAARRRPDTNIPCKPLYEGLPISQCFLRETFTLLPPEFSGRFR